MKRSLLVATATLIAGAAMARVYNYDDIGLGERSYSMGNTAMAVSGDVGNAYYNPAVLSWSRGNQMAASVSAYERIDSRTGSFVSAFQSALDNVKRGGFESVPSMIGANLQNDRLTWGGSILVPTSFQNAGTEGDSSKFFSYDGTAQDVWMNVFAAYKVSENNRYGISLFYISKEIREKFTTADINAGTVESRFEERYWDVNGLALLIGGVHVLSDNWKVGWSIRSPVWKWGGDGQLTVIETGNNVGIGKQFTPQLFPLPMRLSVGGSYQINSNLLMALDFHLYPGYGGNLSPNGEDEFYIDAQPIANFGIGFEYFLSKTLGGRIGFHSNLSAARVVPAGMSAVVDKIHMGTATGAIVMRTDNGDLSIGGWLSGGQGYSKNFDSTNLKDVPRSLYLYGAVIASTYKF